MLSLGCELGEQVPALPLRHVQVGSHDLSVLPWPGDGAVKEVEIPEAVGSAEDDVAERRGEQRLFAPMPAHCQESSACANWLAVNDRVSIVLPLNLVCAPAGAGQPRPARTTDSALCGIHRDGQEPRPDRALGVRLERWT
jgi:hypothetical protein